MTVFCANNVTNNIRHGMTSYYPTMSGVATAKSLEGMVIGMGFTMAVLQYFTMEGIREGWIRDCVKGDEAKGSGRRKSPVGSKGKVPVRSLGTVPEDRNGCKNLRRGAGPFRSVPLQFFSPSMFSFPPSPQERYNLIRWCPWRSTGRKRIRCTVKLSESYWWQSF